MAITGGRHDLNFQLPRLYKYYSNDEERRRTNLHYAKSAEFFEIVTGGEWNVYSCNIWDNASDVTDSQTRKLDLFAKIANLQPGQKILDVGCGWGGPLVYLSKRYGVSGVGITASPVQQIAAQKRADRYGVDLEIVESHWADFETGTSFDLIYSDEVLVHINDLGHFFERMNSLLNLGGLMLHKELHLTHGKYAQRVTPGSSFINEIFGETGNYRTLADELTLLMQARFRIVEVYTLQKWHYRKTIDFWIVNMKRHRSQLTKIDGEEFYFAMLKYLKLARMFVMSNAISIDIVHSANSETFR